MSTVYLARDETLERWIAIKVLHREISDQPDQIERFRREARSVAQLSHPNVVSVIDAGEDGGYPYIVFEYVEGETLKQRIERLGHLPLDESAAYAIEIARGLGTAHLQRLDPPRRQAAERAHRRRGPRQGHRLRDRALARVRPRADRHRARARHHRLRLTRAGDGPGRGRALRHLLARRRALRDDRRRRPVPRRDAGRRRDEARQRPGARRARPAARGLRRARRRRRPRDREGPRRPLRRHAGDARRPRERARGRGRARRRRDAGRGDERAGLRPRAAAQDPHPQARLRGRA